MEAGHSRLPINTAHLHSAIIIVVIIIFGAPGQLLVFRQHVGSCERENKALPVLLSSSSKCRPVLKTKCETSVQSDRYILREGCIHMQQSGINSADELSHIEAPVSVLVVTPPPEGMGMI